VQRVDNVSCNCDRGRLFPKGSYQETLRNGGVISLKEGSYPSRRGHIPQGGVISLKEGSYQETLRNGWACVSCACRIFISKSGGRGWAGGSHRMNAVLCKSLREKTSCGLEGEG